MRNFALCRRAAAQAVFACVVTALVASAPARAADCPYADAAPGTATDAQLSDATVCLLNERRTADGLKPLATSTPLATTAQNYAQYMVSADHFAHMDESGGDVVTRVMHTDPAEAHRWGQLGENLGWGTYELATPRGMVEGWMKSPEHRANILRASYDEIGVGTSEGAPVPGATHALTYATVFGALAPRPKRAHPHRKCHKKRRSRCRR